MDSQILRQSILETVENFKKTKHIENPFGHTFSVQYYAVSNNNIIKSYSPVIFEKCDWGVILIHYGERYHGYVNHGVKHFYILPNKSICDKIMFGQWEINHVKMNSDPFYAFNKSINKELFFGENLDECLEVWLKLYPLIKDCSTKEAVDRVFEIYRENNDVSKKDIIDKLVEENNLLKDKIAKISSLLNE